MALLSTLDSSQAPARFASFSRLKEVQRTRVHAQAFSRILTCTPSCLQQVHTHPHAQTHMQHTRTYLHTHTHAHISMGSLASAGHPPPHCWLLRVRYSACASQPCPSRRLCVSPPFYSGLASLRVSSRPCWSSSSLSSRDTGCSRVPSPASPASVRWFDTAWAPVSNLYLFR